MSPVASPPTRRSRCLPALVDAGARRAVMTAGAEHFVGRTALSALASEPVQTSLWDEASPIPHTASRPAGRSRAGRPATARLLAAYAAGLSTDLLPTPCSPRERR
ncbi:MAG: hypothetical protein R2713_04800 [Ilumatobacteraceae bacterium]